MSTFLMILTVLIFLPLAFPVMLIVHELGHAITALLLTPKTVIAFIGNPVDKVKWNFKLGRLNLKLTTNFFWTSRGHASYSRMYLTWFKRFVITLMGPLSVAILFGLASAMVGYDSSMKPLEGTNLLWALLFLLGFFEIYSQIHPSSITKTRDDDGMIVMNDGMEILSLLAIKDKAKEYDLGMFFMDKGDYSQALAIFNDIKDNGIKNHIIENEIIRCQKMLDSVKK